MSIPIIPNYTSSLAYGAYADLSAFMTILKARVSCPGIGTGKPLFIGDSTLNQMAYSTACGEWVITLGINGMRAHDFLPWIPQIMQIVQPSDVVVGLGKNDMVSSPTSNGPYWSWVQDDWWLAHAIKNPSDTWHDSSYAGATPILMTIIPTEQTMASGLAAYNNPSLLAQFNDYIRALAANMDCLVQDACAALAGSNGYLPSGTTEDGLHPKGTLQATLWGQYVAALQQSRAARGASTSNVLPSALIP